MSGAKKINGTAGVVRAGATPEQSAVQPGPNTACTKKQAARATPRTPTQGEVPPEIAQGPAPQGGLDMAQVVGQRDILMICLDTLRWDVAFAEQENGGTPVLNRYGPWVKSFAPGNFTLPSHQAMFAGFLPAPATARGIGQREMLFFPEGIGLGKAPAGSFAFKEATFVQALAGAGYQTNCVGGVSFFNKRGPLNSVFPAMFQHSFWRPAFGCLQKGSVEAQVDFIRQRLEKTPQNRRVFYYLNVCAIHYPNWFYLNDNGQPQNRADGPKSHAAALRHVDGKLEKLFVAFKKRGPALVLALSDHGTCYGEDGFNFHGLPHPAVDTVPYKRFFL